MTSVPCITVIRDRSEIRNVPSEIVSGSMERASSRERLTISIQRSIMVIVLDTAETRETVGWVSKKNSPEMSRHLSGSRGQPAQRLRGGN